MNSLASLADYILLIPAIIIAMSFHEAAHAYSAHFYGDDTAKMHGRLTLNPLAHLDPVGFLMLLLFQFGWAKPVPVNPYNFRGNKRVADFVVSIAGITVNFIMAVLTFILLSNLTALHIYNEGLIRFLQILAQLNIFLAAFNILPIPPLDGSKMLAAILPESMAEVIWFLDRYGMFILILLLITGAYNYFLMPIANALFTAALYLATLI